MAGPDQTPVFAAIFGCLLALGLTVWWLLRPKEDGPRKKKPAKERAASEEKAP